MNTIFRVKTFKKQNKILIKCVGKLTENEKLLDEELETYDLDENHHTVFYKCNLTSSFLVSTKIIPVMYASVFHKQQITQGILFDIFIRFGITSDVKNDKELIGSPLEGKYFCTVVCDGKDIKNEPLEYFHGKIETIEYIKNLLKSETITKLIKDQNDKRYKERIKKYGSFTDFEIPKPTFNFDKLVNEYKKTGKINLTSNSNN